MEQANIETHIINFKYEIEKVRRQFSQQLSPNQVNQATARALNRMATMSRTDAVSRIRKKVAIKQGALNKSFVIRKANRNNLTAILGSSGRPLPVMAFPARQTGSGVSVLILNQRKIIRSAFIALVKGGHRGVFARGEYQTPKFAFRKKRIRSTGPDLPIQELKTLSIPQMFSKQIIVQELINRVKQELPTRLFHELTRMT